MISKKTLPEREKELQALLATSEGRAALQELDAQYHAASGKVRPAKASVITYILVHERQRGLIGN
jgi:phage-related tail protein